MNFTIEVEQEEDGRWLAEVQELPGVLAYGHTPKDATTKVQALALRVLDDRAAHVGPNCQSNRSPTGGLIV